MSFRTGADGVVEGLEWRRPGGATLSGRRLQLPEETFTFPSGDLALRGKLVLPPASSGPGPYPAVVLVDGSESYSAVDYYFEPYLYAAHGIATLAYDKRGTGESEGEYTQNFHVLAGDRSPPSTPCAPAPTSTRSASTSRAAAREGGSPRWRRRAPGASAAS